METEETSLTPLLTEVILAFFLTVTLLYRYGNIFRHHIIVTISVLVAWFFSMIIIFVLPLDVSSTVYRQCIKANTDNGTVNSLNNETIKPSHPCKVPWSHVPENVFPNLWRVVYWSSQFLTWLVLPLMQSYIKAGDFTIQGKLKSALVDNIIYYGSYLFICSILLIYIALKPGLDLDGQKLKAIASSASNTWGLFLLVLLLGYALVEVPRNIWNASKSNYTLHYRYFKIAKLSLEKCEAEENVDDILESLQIASIAINPGHPYFRNLETIFQKVPVELKDRMNRRQLPDDTPIDVPSEKALIRLHRQTIKSLQTLQRTETQWGMLVQQIFELEDIAKNQTSHDRRFKHSFPIWRNKFLQTFYNSTLEWWWKCVLKKHVQQVIAIGAGILSISVVWCEVVFFSKSPVLSIFALIVNVAKRNYNYFTIEIFSTLIIAYLCYCAYSMVLKIRVLNLYYLAPHHQTDEYSLIFSGMMLCRLTPPLCLNFLSLIHMDSHIIKMHILETHYTQVMGHMDVISIISDGFNIYFPMTISALCLATYFSLGNRFLSMLGFQQFLDDDELTADMVEEGRELIKRERRKRLRTEDSHNRRREFRERINLTRNFPRARTRPSSDTVRSLKRDVSVESARADLLHDFDPSENYNFGSDTYGANTRIDHMDDFEDRFEGPRRSTNQVGYPPRGIFDDI